MKKKSCIQCGKSGFFLKLNDAMLCESCAKIEQAKQEKEEQIAFQKKVEEEKRNVIIRKEKIQQVTAYYESLCEAYQIVADNMAYPSIYGLSEEQIKSKYEACHFLLNELPKWNNYDYFADIYLQDCRICEYSSHLRENPRLPIPAFFYNEIPDFCEAFKDMISKLFTMETKFLLARDVKSNSAKSNAHITHKYPVAGITHYEKNIRLLSIENPDYSMSKHECVECCMTDIKIWKYSFHTVAVELIPEPTNEHDPNAIKVVVDGMHIGYIQADCCQYVKNLLETNSIRRISCNIGGGPYKCISEDYDWEKDKEIYTVERDNVPYTAVILIEC